MRGDFSRITPDSGNYSAVHMQQGRVLFDADWNAAVGASLWAQRALAADLIGPHGGPREHLGFTPTLVDRDGRVGLELSAGVYYVDGLRCELPASLVPVGYDGMPWNQQPYPIAIEPLELPAPSYLVYLDVWERHVTALEDDALRALANDGLDTTRRQVIWQVRVMPHPTDGGAPTSNTFPLRDWRDALRGEPPRMRATTAEPVIGAQDGLAVAPNAGFYGGENHLYRVEIVSGRGGQGTPALFAWSRENGSVAAEWTATEGNRLGVVALRDDRIGFTPGDWVELTWDILEFAGIPATRTQLVAVEGSVLTINLDTASGPIDSEPSQRPHAKIRRWDQRDTNASRLVDGAVAVAESATDWIALEDGVLINFDRGETDKPYIVGDYWTIPARASTADIDWPRDVDGEPLALPPQGPVHHYAPLGYVSDDNLVCLQKVFAALATGF